MPQKAVGLNPQQYLRYTILNKQGKGGLEPNFMTYMSPNIKIRQFSKLHF